MNNKKKLQKEIQNIRLDMETLAEKKEKALLKAYKRGLDDVRKELGLIYAKYAKNGVITPNKRVRASILASLEKQLTEIAKEINEKDQEVTSSILEEVYKKSYYKTVYVIEKGIDGIIDFSILNSEQIEKVVFREYKDVIFSDRIWKNKKLLIKRLKRELERGFIRGESIDQVSNRIKKTFGSSAYESKRLIQTEISRVINEAQEKIYKDSGIVYKVMYDATLDGRTSVICRGLDGNTYDINSDFPKPPQHPNCRSVLVPIILEWTPRTRKDNVTKQIIDYTTYEKWEKTRGMAA